MVGQAQECIEVPGLLRGWTGKILSLASDDFIRRVSGTYAVRMGLMVISMATGVMMTRALGPEGRGQLAAATVVTGLAAQFLNLGLHSSNTYMLARDRSLLPVVIGNSAVVSLGFGGATVIVGILIMWMDPRLLPISGVLAVLAFVAVPLRLLSLFWENLLLATQRIRIFNFNSIFLGVVGLALFLVVWALDCVNATTVFATSVVAALLSVAFLWWGLRPLLVSRMRVSLRFLMSGFAYGLKSYFACLLAWLVVWFNQLLIKYILGAEQLGYFAVAASMSDMMVVLPATVGMILFPTLCARESDGEKWCYARKVMVWVSLVMGLLVLLAAVLARPAIVLLFGPEFGGAVVPFRWLLPGVWMLSISSILMNYFASVGNPMIVVYSPALALVVSLAANLLLIPRRGVVGAAWASSLSCTVMVLGGATYVYVSVRKGTRQSRTAVTPATARDELRDLCGRE